MSGKKVTVQKKSARKKTARRVNPKTFIIGCRSSTKYGKRGNSKKRHTTLVKRSWWIRLNWRTGRYSTTTFLDVSLCFGPVQKLYSEQVICIFFRFYTNKWTNKPLLHRSFRTTDSRPLSTLAYDRPSPSRSFLPITTVPFFDVDSSSGCTALVTGIPGPFVLILSVRDQTSASGSFRLLFIFQYAVLL